MRIGFVRLEDLHKALFFRLGVSSTGSHNSSRGLLCVEIVQISSDILLRYLVFVLQVRL